MTNMVCHSEFRTPSVTVKAYRWYVTLKTFLSCWICTRNINAAHWISIQRLTVWKLVLWPKRTRARRCSAHAARARPRQQRGRQLWTTSQSPAVDWSSFQGGEGAGSLPFPVHMAGVRCRIMGGIASSPAVLVHRASQTNMKNNDIAGQASFLQLRRPLGRSSCRRSKPSFQQLLDF